MRVLFLGFGTTGQEYKFDDFDEIWTCNDWYRKYPDLVVDRVYEPHTLQQFDRQPKKRRYHNLKENYETKAKLVKCADSYGIKNEVIINGLEYMNDFDLTFFGSSFGYMFADAILEGKITEICLRGVDIDGPEYRHQGKSVLDNINAARNAGIDVHAPNERFWLNEYSKTQTIGQIYGLMWNYQHVNPSIYKKITEKGNFDGKKGLNSTKL